MSLDTGSSPHAWGLPHLLTSAAAKNRFIPTCVGFTPPECPCSSCDTVHPHMRGVYIILTRDMLSTIGSSPHAWGLPDRVLRVVAFCRFIPTCVGFTAKQTLGPPRKTVHPHMRGVYLSGSLKYHSLTGSSPHAWGLLREDSGTIDRVRFIPTCVGFTGPLF